MFLRYSFIFFYIFHRCASDSTYECGVHGKFEYCIDGIPGCVIGCHCHPGYYFDTDTKVCEPNIKLTQDFRRHYLSAEPTRVHLEPMITSPSNDIMVVERTTKSLIDQKVDDIAKDADDLGDWLYNQFFKTIENQVINKTNGENLPTRRSGGNIKKPVRRSHKKHYRSRKPKKSKKNNLKDKLLRITEDDSLFDSSSSETETDDDSSSSASSEDSEDSKSSTKKKGHGHKKIVIFNKKPRPPLPSFIFLPNMDTPFFPPIGLPPPAVPMYPMVPVPPVMGPMFPFPFNCNNENSPTTAITTAAIVSSTVTSATMETKPEKEPEPATKPSPKPLTEPTSEPKTTQGPEEEHVPDQGPDPKHEQEPETDPAHQSEQEPEKQDGQKVSGEENVPNTLRQRRIKHPLRTRNQGFKNRQHFGPRNKLLQKLRQKMVRKNKLENFIADQYQDGPHLMNLPPDFEPGSDQMKLNIMEKPPSSHPDVDFKYLTELIHRMEPNDTSGNNMVNPIMANEMPPPNRRNFDANQQYTLYRNKTRRQPQKADDSYYSNLGRQIASMIKNIDLSGDREIDVEIERNSGQGTPIQHVFNENGGYGSRSYWERSVRSPLKYVSEFKKAPNYSNEHLFKLENQVEYAASTEHTLSLQELESIISEMKKTQERRSYKEPQMIYKKVNEPIMRSPSKISFSLISKNENMFKEPKTIPTTKLPIVWRKPNKKEIIGSGLDSFLLSNYHRPSPLKKEFEKSLPKTEINALKTELTTIKNIPIYNVFVKPTRQPIRFSEVAKKPKKIWYHPKYKPTSNPSPIGENINHQKYSLSPMTPVLLKHQNLNYNSNNNNQFLLEKQTIPVHLQHFVSRRLNPYVKKNKPSYFYHEFHHLDYFDQQ